MRWQRRSRRWRWRKQYRVVHVVWWFRKGIADGKGQFICTRSRWQWWCRRRWRCRRCRRCRRRRRYCWVLDIGPSFDILGFNIVSSALVESNTFTYDDSVARGGTGGQGGVGGAEESGPQGIDGASRRQLDMRSCLSNNRCPSEGYSCNKDNVCVPKS